MQTRSFLFLLLFTAALAKEVYADTLKVLTTGAFKQVVVAVAADYEKRTGHHVDIQNDTAGAISKRVAADESFDVLVLPPTALNTFVASGVVERGSVIALAKVAIGVAVKVGTTPPALRSVDDFKNIISQAHKVALINPASGGSSGIYLEGLFQRMGLTEVVNAKTVWVNGGLVAEKVATGEADVAIHQISEILPVAGVVLVGPLPDTIQNFTTYAAALHTNAANKEIARSFLQSFSTAKGSALIQEKGMMALN